MTNKKTLPPFKEDILNAVLSHTPPSRLYHYTDQSGLLGIVQSKKLRATHHQCLNDTQEYLHAKKLVRTELDSRCASALNSDSRTLFDAMRAILDGPGNEDVNLYVASFSEDGDSLSQWRAYGGVTSGFALGFSADLALPERFTVVRCIYEPGEQQQIVKAIVAEVERTVAGMPAIGPSNSKLTVEALLRLNLHRLALVLKHPKFIDEREWRIISPVMMDIAPAYPIAQETELGFRQDKSMLKPYRSFFLKDLNGKFPLTDVVVGPNPNPGQSLRSVRSLLNSEPLLASVGIRSSDVPYRNW